MINFFCVFLRAGSLLGKRPEVNRLLGSLAVDVSKNRDLLGWKPPVSVEDGLKETMQWFLKEKSVNH